MASRRQQHLPAVHRIRESEGPVIGVAKKTASGTAIGIDFSGAPVPDRRFPADGAWVAVGDDMVRIVFAQFRAAGPEIEHIVTVRVSFEGARHFLKTMESVAQGSEESVIETARKHLAKIKAAPSPKIDRKSTAKQSFTLDANILIAGFSNREACLDLYQSSPQVKLAILRGSTEFRAEPVARVTLTTRLLTELFEELSAASIPTDGQDDGVEVEIE